MTTEQEPVLRSIEDLDEPLVKSERCYTLANARVIWAHYDLIQRDFTGTDFVATMPCAVNLPAGVRSLPVSDRPDIDAWLLLHAAVISEAQLRPNTINEEIPVCGPTRVGYRPPRYGRALVVQVADTWPDYAYASPDHRPQGLLDVKGCGVAPCQIPQLQVHRSGLLDLPTALCELASQLIIERIFHYLSVDVCGLGIYAILDLGFRMKVHRGSVFPACAIIRRAHRRPPGNIERPIYGSEQHRIKLAIEFILRSFGLTSCSPDTQFRIWSEDGNLRSCFRGALDKIPPAALERFLAKMSLQVPVNFDMINVQLVRGATLAPLSAVLVDFGQYGFSNKEFIDPLACFVENRPLSWGGFIDRTSPYWVQPDPQIVIKDVGDRIPTPHWFFEWAAVGSPAETSALFAFAAELARDATRWELTRSDFERRIGAFVASATRKLEHHQETAKGSNRDLSTGSLDSANLQGGAAAGVPVALAYVDGFLSQNWLRWKFQKPSGL